MAWACVEKVLDMPGFFTMLAEIYKEGYFPCPWKGNYPSGQAVVLQGLRRLFPTGACWLEAYLCFTEEETEENFLWMRRN